jgi:mannose-6-phosphate isomerase-like protein (cupin superfamily)
MRAAAIVLVVMMPMAARAQQAPAPPKLFVSSGEVLAMIAKANTDRKPDQANLVQPMVRLAPYTANLEYRVAGINANASVHETEAEMFYVVDGSGTLVTGGTLRDGRRTNATNLTGTGIDGGTKQRLGKGDFVIVPQNTPHWFGEVDGALVMMSIHLPK